MEQESVNDAQSFSPLQPNPSHTNEPKKMTGTAAEPAAGRARSLWLAEPEAEANSMDSETARALLQGGIDYEESCTPTILVCTFRQSLRSKK